MLLEVKDNHWDNYKPWDLPKGPSCMNAGQKDLNVCSGYASYFLYNIKDIAWISISSSVR